MASSSEVIERIGDRFERRLTEETSKLRVEMAQGFGAVRQELASGLAAVRQEMAAGLGGLRQEMAEQRVELLKWAFLFWAGQLSLAPDARERGALLPLVDTLNLPPLFNRQNYQSDCTWRYWRIRWSLVTSVAPRCRAVATMIWSAGSP
jgi:hypothetical protein